MLHDLVYILAGITLVFVFFRLVGGILKLDVPDAR